MEKAYMPALVQTDFGDMAIMIPGINRHAVDILDEHDIEVTIRNSGDVFLDITFNEGYIFYHRAWEDDGVFDYIADVVQAARE